MNRAMRANEAYLKRIRKSMDAEVKARFERDARREERERSRREAIAARQEAQQAVDDRHRMYNESIAQKTRQYAQFWISSSGVGVPEIVHAVRNGFPLTNSHITVRTYNNKTKKQEEHPILCLLHEIAGAGFPPVQPDDRGQVRWCGDMFVAYDIYDFIRTHWSAVGPSVLPLSAES